MRAESTLLCAERVLRGNAVRRKQCTAWNAAPPHAYRSGTTPSSSSGNSSETTHRCQQRPEGTLFDGCWASHVIAHTTHTTDGQAAIAGGFPADKSS
jgi:hypothetical protein